MIGIFNLQRLWQAAADTTRRLIKYRQLLIQQVKQEFFEQHMGQTLGGVWLFAHPLFMMLVYVFVFSVVFKLRLERSFEMPLDYTSYILAGLIPWLTFQQALAKSTTALTANASLIKQVVFPIEVLPAKTVISTLLPLLIMIAALMLYVLATNGSLPWTYVLIPVLIAIHLMWIMGVGLLFSAATVFLRDIRELVTMYSLAGVFVAPVVYLPAWIPPAFKPVLYANPVSYLVWCYQDVLYFGRFEHPVAWIVAILFGFLIYGFGARAFVAMKPYYGDMLW